jgi:DNA primase
MELQDVVLDIVRRYLPDRSFRPTGDGNWQTTCPIHKGGQERSPSFSINPAKGLFHCFACHEAGPINVLLRKLGVPGSTIDREMEYVRPLLERSREQWKLQKQNAFVSRDPFLAPKALSETLLDIFNYCPYLLTEKGFDPSLLQKLQIGFDPFQRRITYPLRDLYGNLAGIVGGASDPSQWPKYKVYEGRKTINGCVYQGDFGSAFDEQNPDYRCENHDYLWNFHDVYARLLMSPDKDTSVILVEGFKACMWVLQCGYPNTVALMGTYLSDRQRQMLERLQITVYLFLDNDEAGARATGRICSLLKQSMNWGIRVVPYPQEHWRTQPDNYAPNQIHWMISNSQSAIDYLRRHPTKGTKRYGQ